MPTPRRSAAASAVLGPCKLKAPADPRDLEYWRAAALVASTALEATLALIARLPDWAGDLTAAAERDGVDGARQVLAAIAQEISAPVDLFLEVDKAPASDRRRVVEILGDPLAAHCRGLALALAAAREITLSEALKAMRIHALGAIDPGDERPR